MLPALPSGSVDLHRAGPTPARRLWIGRAGTTMRRWMDRWRPHETWPGFLLAAGLLLALVFAALDPGPSRGLAAGGRLVFWMAHVLIPLALLQAAQIGVSRSLGLRRLPDWGQVLSSGVAGAVAFTPVALLLDRAFPVAGAMKDADGPIAVQFAAELASILPASILVWAGLNATRLLRLQAPAEPAADAPTSTAPEFWTRVPHRLGGDLVALSAELHYLRVHTVLGDTLILYPFGRAVEELGDIGHRIHRSHWVAEHHIASVERDGERRLCRTDTGLLLPISRPYRRKLGDLCASRGSVMRA